jgi:hypothetical protein
VTTTGRCRAITIWYPEPPTIHIANTDDPPTIHVANADDPTTHPLFSRGTMSDGEITELPTLEARMEVLCAALDRIIVMTETFAAGQQDLIDKIEAITATAYRCRC